MPHGLLRHAAAAQDPFESALDEVEALRSQDPQRFALRLAELRAAAGHASKAQQQRLQYLEAFRLTFLGDYDAAVAIASVLFAEAEDSDLRFRAGVLIANCHAGSTRFADGLLVLGQLRAMQDAVADPEIRVLASQVAAVLYNQIGQYELARDAAETVLRDSQHPRSRCLAGQLRLESLHRLGEWPRDRAVVDAAVRYCQEHGERYIADMLLVFVARQARQEGDIQGAGRIMRELLPDLAASGFARLIAEVHSMLAELALTEGDLDDAARHAAVAANQEPGIGFSQPVVSAHHVLYQVALRRGDSEAALRHYRSYSEADRAWLDSVRLRELAYQMVRHELDSKNQTIELLQRRNEVLQLEQQVSSAETHNVRLLLALLLAVLVALVSWSWRIKRLQLAFRRMAETDGLTGIDSRLHFTRRAQAAIAAAEIEHRVLSLIMLDLDHFKSINDQHGHAAGDWALREVARLLAEFCRHEDRVGRMGGEEFAILLLGCEPEMAYAVAERCRERIATIDTRPGGFTRQLTASFGIASTAGAGYAFDRLLSQADEALYQAKGEGRNRVSVYRAVAGNDATGAREGAPSEGAAQGL